MEVELKRLEDLSEAIVQDFARMRKNEEEMRDTNGMSRKKKETRGNERSRSRVQYRGLYKITVS